MGGKGLSAAKPLSGCEAKAEETKIPMTRITHVALFMYPSISVLRTAARAVGKLGRLKAVAIQFIPASAAVPIVALALQVVESPGSAKQLFDFSTTHQTPNQSRIPGLNRFSW